MNKPRPYEHDYAIAIHESGHAVIGIALGNVTETVDPG